MNPSIQTEIHDLPKLTLEKNYISRKKADISAK